MKMPERFEPAMLAPCGVNCHACSAFLKAKDPCPGCRALGKDHPRRSCANCVKKKCAFAKGLEWCFECAKFPCARIRDLSRRYVQNYGIDLVQDGLAARDDMDAFLQAQQKRFACGNCGGVMDQHHRRCSECGSGV